MLLNRALLTHATRNSLLRSNVVCCFVFAFAKLDFMMESNDDDTQAWENTIKGRIKEVSGRGGSWQEREF